MSRESRAKQREFLKRPARFSTKAWYAVFLLSKNASSAASLSSAPCSRLFVWTLACLGSDRCSEPYHFGFDLPTRPQYVANSLERFILFTMSEVPYSVSVVLDRDFGERVRELLEAGPVWIVDSAPNRTSAQSIWAAFPERDHLDGVTIFKASADRDPAQVLVDEMDTIDMHHGVYSANPAYTVMHVIGCQLRPEVQKKLEEFGFDSFTCTSEGFEASRPLPPPLGC